MMKQKKWSIHMGMSQPSDRNPLYHSHSETTTTRTSTVQIQNDDNRRQQSKQIPPPIPMTENPLGFAISDAINIDSIEDKVHHVILGSSTDRFDNQNEQRVPFANEFPDIDQDLFSDLSDIHKDIDKTKNNITGMICVAISVFLMLSASAIFSYASITLKLSLFQCLIVANLVQHSIAWLLWFAPAFIFRKPRHIKAWYGEQDSRRLIWFRGFLYFCDEYLYWTGILLLPLGDAECIYFLCPIFIAFGARFILKERFSKTFPFIFVLTAIGVLILSQPPWITNWFESNGTARYFQSGNISIKGLIFLLVGCVCWALMSLTVRKIPKAHWLQMELASSLQCFALWTPLLILINWLLEGTGINLDNGGHWDFSLYPMLICAGIGTLGVFAFMFLVIGYQHGEATKVSWLECMNVPIGYMYQYVLFRDCPNIYETIGASIMLTTGVIEIASEWYLYRKAQSKLSEQRALHQL